MPLHRGFSRPNWCRNEVLPRLVNSTLPIRKFFPHIATSSVVLRCRFRLTRQGTLISQCYRSGDVAEWLRSGLQIRVHRFDSGRRLHRTPLWTLSKSLTSPSPFGIPICHREKLSQIAPCQVRREKIEACLIGEVPEWSNGAVSKTVVPLRAPRVRIPVSPPPSPPRFNSGNWPGSVPWRPVVCISTQKTVRLPDDDGNQSAQSIRTRGMDQARDCGS